MAGTPQKCGSEGLPRFRSTHDPLPSPDWPVCTRQTNKTLSGRLRISFLLLAAFYTQCTGRNFVRFQKNFIAKEGMNMTIETAKKKERPKKQVKLNRYGNIQKE